MERTFLFLRTKKWTTVVIGHCSASRATQAPAQVVALPRRGGQASWWHPTKCHSTRWHFLRCSCPVSQLPAPRSKPEPSQPRCSHRTCSPAKWPPLSLACRTPAGGDVLGFCPAPDPACFQGIHSLCFCSFPGFSTPRRAGSRAPIPRTGQLWSKRACKSRCSGKKGAAASGFKWERL